MASNSTRIVARLLWIIPLFLVLLTVHQGKTAYDLRHTLTHGEEATAEVTEVHSENRVDVTYDYVDLRVRLDNGQVFEREKLSLPHTLIDQMEGKKEVPVKVLPNAPQEVVLAELGHSQWRIAAIQAAFAGIAALLFGIGVYAWNRYLHRRGDPSEQEASEEHPAAQAVRAK